MKGTVIHCKRAGRSFALSYSECRNNDTDNLFFNSRFGQFDQSWDNLTFS